jgi:hypothetical protein
LARLPKALKNISVRRFAAGFGLRLAFFVDRLFATTAKYLWEQGRRGLTLTLPCRFVPIIERNIARVRAQKLKPDGK